MLRFLRILFFVVGGAQFAFMLLCMADSLSRGHAAAAFYLFLAAFAAWCFADLSRKGAFNDSF